MKKLLAILLIVLLIVLSASIIIYSIEDNSRESDKTFIQGFYIKEDTPNIKLTETPAQRLDPIIRE